jgi:hypothetical protein
LVFGMILVGNAAATLVMNIAFQRNKAILVIPLQSAGNYLIPVFAGLYLFQQSFLYGIFFWPAFFLVIAGVLFLSRIQAQIQEFDKEAKA